MNSSCTTVPSQGRNAIGQSEFCPVKREKASKEAKKASKTAKELVH